MEQESSDVREHGRQGAGELGSQRAGEHLMQIYLSVALAGRSFHFAPGACCRCPFNDRCDRLLFSCKISREEVSGRKYGGRCLKKCFPLIHDDFVVLYLTENADIKVTTSTESQHTKDVDGRTVQQGRNLEITQLCCQFLLCFHDHVVFAVKQMSNFYDTFLETY